MLMVNQRLMDYNTKNGGVRYLSRKKEDEEIIVRFRKKGELKTKTLSRITKLDGQDPSLQSADRTKTVKV